MKTETEAFGARLRRLIEERGYASERQFARRIGMEPTYLSRILNGHVERPAYETLRKLSEALAVPVSDLASWTGLLEPSPRNGGEDAALNDVVKTIESRGDLMEQLAEIRANNTSETYQRFMRGLAKSWESSLRLAVDSFALRGEQKKK
ncbi:MAG TPA: helix-turn-helix transcriptional regulator [Thermomicrobiales bacterium]|nr:helix-turn-helix transcriptional regulator [Thermomicrobiales bacterium]